MSYRTAYGYSHSENGWRMLTRSSCVTALPALDIPYTDTAPVRSGDVATILNAWIIWYRRHVEPLNSPVWGWSARNSVPNSNHLSGTAVDINAPQYPWGHVTMPQSRVETVAHGLALFEGTVFWGRRWPKPDEMHYQIGYPEGDSRIRDFAARLSAGHLAIYTPQEDAPMDELTADEWREMLDSIRYIRGQLEPWSQLGTNDDGDDLTLVDSVADLRQRVRDTADAVEEVHGTVDQIDDNVAHVQNTVIDMADERDA